MRARLDSPLGWLARPVRGVPLPVLGHPAPDSPRQGQGMNDLLPFRVCAAWAYDDGWVVVEWQIDLSPYSQMWMPAVHLCLS